METITDDINFKQFCQSCMNAKRTPRFTLDKGLGTYGGEVQKALKAAYFAEVKARTNLSDDVILANMNNGAFPEMFVTVMNWLLNDRERVGLLLYGNVGTGKTTMLRAICKVVNLCTKPGYNDLTLLDTPKQAVNIVRAKDAVEAYQGNRPFFDRMCRVELLAIDEFGVEAIDVRSFGNSNEPIIDLLSTRYDKQRVTMISSNLDLEQIKARYGERLQDRFYEMFKMVAFTGKSFRK